MIGNIIKKNEIEEQPMSGLEISRTDGLTDKEGQVMDALISAFNAFCSLEQQHPDELRDFTDGIHKCQDLLAVRIARRIYPIGWPVKK